jgi:hypothetical protein
MPGDSVTLRQLLPLTLQESYKSRANIAQPNDPEVVAVDGGFSGNECLSTIVSGSIPKKKRRRPGWDDAMLDRSCLQLTCRRK